VSVVAPWPSPILRRQLTELKADAIPLQMPRTSPTKAGRFFMTKAKAPVSAGVKKQVDGDYKKRRKPVPSEATLAKRSAAKEKAVAAREKAAAARALAKTAAATNTTKPKPKPKTKPKTKPQPVKNHKSIPAQPRCYQSGYRMVWRSFDYLQRPGGRIIHKKMMRAEQGRVKGHWLKEKILK
jgi:hypothetical protein